MHNFWSLHLCCYFKIKRSSIIQHDTRRDGACLMFVIFLTKENSSLDIRYYEKVRILEIETKK